MCGESRKGARPGRRSPAQAVVLQAGCHISYPLGKISDIADRGARGLLVGDLAELACRGGPEAAGDEADVLRLHLGDLDQYLRLRGEVTVAEKRDHAVAGEPVQNLMAVIESEEQVVAALGVVH